MLYLKIGFLFLATWWTIVNTSFLIENESIPWLNFFIQAVGITGFIALQWLI